MERMKPEDMKTDCNQNQDVSAPKEGNGEGERLVIGLHTAWEWSFNELYEVIGLFYPAASVRETEGNEAIRIEQTEKLIRILFPQDSISEEIGDLVLTGDPLDDRRTQKRAIKSILYKLLKQRTGIHPPWGSLTGIRPTRLYYERLSMGESPEQALRSLQTKFDVTTEKTEILRDIANMQEGFMDLPADEIDVYAGIPFCPTRCSYCAFAATAVTKSTQKLVEPYLQALLREIELCAAEMRRIGKHARALYIGGGTPTTLDETQLSRLVAAIQKGFPGCREFTVEAGRPDTITPEKLTALKEGGVTRVAINPQSMNEKTLHAIGRSHTPQQIVVAYEMMRKAGFDSINMDVIAALPGETLEDFQKTIREVLALCPDNLTCHALALKRTSSLNTEGYNHLSASLSADMIRFAAEECEKAGLLPYYLYRQKKMAGNEDNIGYALPGKQCLYNIDNMEETTPVLAMGAGAISKWLYDRRRRIERAPNVREISQYIARVEEMFMRKKALWDAE